MRLPPEPCDVCGFAAVRTLFAKAYCGTHLAALYAKFDEGVFVFNGRGIQHGLLREEYGPLMADLECNSCGASWVGIPGDPCSWCLESLERLAEWQAQLVLTPPNVEADDPQSDGILRAWFGRLKRAAEAGIISDSAGENAWRKATNQ